LPKDPDFREVESARVHLVLPEKSLFAESQQPASASVIIKLGNDSILSKDKVNAITHLVASAVDSLDSNQVTVVDSAGRLLTSAGGDSSVMAGGQVFDQKMQIERSFEKRIVELISPVVGLGKIMARVTANIDFTSTESTDETVDPAKSAVLSESRTTAKKSENSAGSGGTAGAAGNQPGGAGGAGGSGSGNSDEGSEQVNYQVSKTTRKQITPMGSIKNLSVAIVVDGNYTPDKDGKPVYAARSTEELGKLEEVIKKAIGFSSDRGDQIKVESMQFQAVDLSTPATDSFLKNKNTYSFLLNIVGNALVVLVVLLVFFFVVRPMVKSWSSGSGGMEGQPRLVEGELQANVAQLVRADPLAAANAIKQWLK
jgi:flagellar M-ring protein FliF